MGLFGLFRSKPSENSMIRWLNQADEQYNHALRVKNIAGLDRYFTRACIAKISEQARLSEALYSGLDRYRHTEWSKDPKDAAGLTWIKDVTYDNVKMSHGINVPVGDAYHERWLIVIDANTNKIDSIRRLS